LRFFFTPGEPEDGRALGAEVTTDEVVDVEADLVLGTPAAAAAAEAAEAVRVFLGAALAEANLCFGSGFFLGRPRPALATAEGSEDGKEV